ncbi:GNAT family N-acetyltransferase [Leptolyngbya ohadii]|uniref:GNAT family N-acetyltransferase n=1 Tax=Leptolyngbya ohadii TaxID=1962290 RepID=UPI00117B418D|nr:GNAT family N-acetyltransferase [Leptolyngbya ohadii]
MNSVRFRSATLSDTEGVAKVYLSSRKAFVPFAPIAHSEAAVYEWIRNILIPGNQVKVVERGNEIIGMMALATTEETGWIEQLYLHPDGEYPTYAKSRNSEQPVEVCTAQVQHRIH